MRLLFAAATAAALMASAATAQAPAETPFIVSAIQGDIAETLMGELAAKQASTPAVRAYGATLAKDHRAHHKLAVELAKSMQVEVPLQPRAEDLAMITELKDKTGSDFDKAFIDHMIADHDRDISAYQKQYAEGKGAIPRFAIKTLPVLKRHLGMAQKLKG